MLQGLGSGSRAAHRGGDILGWEAGEPPGVHTQPGEWQEATGPTGSVRGIGPGPRRPPEEACRGCRGRRRGRPEWPAGETVLRTSREW